MASVVEDRANRRPRVKSDGAADARGRAPARLISAFVFAALVAVLPLAVALYCALLIRYADTEARLKALVYAVVITGLASAFFGITRQTTQRGEQGFVLQYLAPGSGYAQFINKNHFAYLAEMSLGLLLGLAAGRGVARRKILIPLALAVPIWAALVLSNSRGGVLAMLCQVVLLGATFGVTWRGGARRRAAASSGSAVAGTPPARGGPV